MEMVNKLRLSMEGLERKDFYKYMTIVLGIVIILISLFVFWYYRKVNFLMMQIEDINEVREQRVRDVLRRMDSVKKQRGHVNAILKKEKDFKIAGYFKELVTKHHLSDNKVEDRSSTVELGNAYQEAVLSATFANITMKQLTELLKDIEEKERVYAKSLEIKKSTKTPKTIDVNITIATLQLKTKVGK